MEFIHQPSRSNRLGDYLKDKLSGSWTHFRAAVAFAKRSGTQHVTPALQAFGRIGHVEIIVGIDHRGTSSEALQDLLMAVSPNGQVIVFHNNLPFTFHPKVYLFKSPTNADVVIGSGNLTEGGLFTNYEAGVRLSLELSDPTQVAVLSSIEAVLDTWADPSAGTSLTLDNRLLTELTAQGLTPSEEFATHGVARKEQVSDDTRSSAIPFAARDVPRAPLIQRGMHAPGVTVKGTVYPQLAPTQALSAEPGLTRFVMILQRTDVGVGQITKGTSKRSPEIFIPLAARDASPGFWEWPDGFLSDLAKPGKRDRQGVRMRIGGSIVFVNMMTWPDKHDFRLRSEALRSAGNVEDIMHIEKVYPPGDYEYDVEVIPQGAIEYPEYLSLCSQRVRNSKKKYGYY